MPCLYRDTQRTISRALVPEKGALEIAVEGPRGPEAEGEVEGGISRAVRQAPGQEQGPRQEGVGTPRCPEPGGGQGEG